MPLDSAILSPATHLPPHVVSPFARLPSRLTLHVDHPTFKMVERLPTNGGIGGIARKNAVDSGHFRSGTPVAYECCDKLPHFIHHKEIAVLHWTIMFLIISLIAAVFGFAGIAGAAAGMARILFFVFIVLFLISLVMGRRSDPIV